MIKISYQVDTTHTFGGVEHTIYFNSYLTNDQRSKFPNHMTYLKFPLSQSYGANKDKVEHLLTLWSHITCILYGINHVNLLGRETINFWDEDTDTLTLTREVG
jgi:hypothetical protein